MNFNKRLQICIKENVTKYGDETTKAERDFFFEMVLITYSNRKEMYETLDENGKKLKAHNNEEALNCLSRKVEMLIEELSVFLEMLQDFNVISNLKDQTEQEISSLNDKRLKLLESDVETVGFFKKVSKEDKLTEFKEEIEKHKEKRDMFDGLLNILAKIMLENEMRTIKRRKKERFTGSLEKFALKRVKYLEDSKNYWQSILDDDIADDNPTQQTIQEQ